jgi:hypothetical protein
MSDFVPTSGESGHSASFKLKYEDIDGRSYAFKVEMAFDSKFHLRRKRRLTRDLATYPQQYSLLCFSDDTVPKRASRAFARVSEIFRLDIREVVTALIMSLQGDDDIDGGASGVLDEDEGNISSDGEEEEWELEDPDGLEYIPAAIASGGSRAAAMDWDLLKMWVSVGKSC